MVNNMTEYVGYHGTDLKCAESIIKSSFRCKISTKHWLGNGIYFFKDKQLAVWWTTKPSQKFGNDIDNPAIIKAIIHCEDDKVCNMFQLETYTFIVEKFRCFMETFRCYAQTDESYSVEKLRCSFFDWLTEIYHIDLIECGFQIDPPEITNGEEFELMRNKFNIPYIQVQLCVKYDSLIKDKCIIE